MDFLELETYKECENKLNDLYVLLNLSKEIEEQMTLLDEMYKYIKSITPSLFTMGKISYYYKKILTLLFKCESLLDGEFLIPNNPIYQSVSSPNLSSDNYSAILDYVVYETRKYLLYLCKGNLSKQTLANYCTISNCKVMNVLDHLGFEDCSYSIVLSPGFVEFPQLYDGSGYHCICILNLDSKYFLIDCTYSQFFSLSRNSLERIGIVNSMNCRAGKFMTMKDRLDVANALLSRGWIELNDQNLKKYLDGFAISYRNGLYYEITNDYSYTTNYTADDYVNFLKGNDSQLNHEDKKTLGFQRVPNSRYL